MYLDNKSKNNVIKVVAIVAAVVAIVIVIRLLLTHSSAEGYGRLQPLKGNKINLNHYVPSPAKVEYDLLHNKIRENISWGTTKYPIDMKLFDDQNLPLN